MSSVRDYIKCTTGGSNCGFPAGAGVSTRLRHVGRRQKGSSLAEFAPALFILFFFALFPAIDLSGVGISYCSCVSLVELQLREACKVPKSQAMDPRGSVQSSIPNAWRPTVMGGIATVVDNPVTQVDYTPGIGNIYVTVTTTFNIHPLLTIPFFPKVPGLGAPFVTTIAKTRILENPAFAVQ